jgi:serine/threonine protein kinase
MRSTGTYSTWLTASSLAGPANPPIRLTYLGDQLRRAGGVRPGAVLAQRYELEAPLAARIPGTLWQARRLRPELVRPETGPEARREGPGVDLRLGVTVQVLDPALVEDPGMLDAFFQEARAAATIDHPHVARVLDYGVDYGLDAGVPFLVLERLLGETLADRLVAEPRLEGRELARIIGEAARGLEALHTSGLVHRRLDPEHLFLSEQAPRPSARGARPSGQAPVPRTQLLFAIDRVFGDNLSLVQKLSNHLSGSGSFGQAFAAQGGSAAAEHARRSRSETSRVEASEYQSPEQLLGHDPIDERSDLWSLAVIAFEAATGRPPFGGSSLGDRLVQICSGEPNLAPADVPLPAGFVSWFEKGVRKLPAERFASARQMADALQRLVTVF